MLAEEAERLGVPLIHFSTDYVFDGTKLDGYIETDAPNPQSVYGKSKWTGEQLVREAYSRHIILRTSWVYGVHGNNFIKTILRLAKERTSLNIVADQFGAPTSAMLLADVACLIARDLMAGSEEFGTYHVTAQGVTNWHEYAKRIVTDAKTQGAELTLSENDIHPIPTEAYPVPAPRPRYSRLNTEKIRAAFPVTLPQWETDVELAIQRILQAQNQATQN